MKHRDIIAVILLTSAVIGFVLLMSGCATNVVKINSPECSDSQVLIATEIQCREVDK